MKLIPIKFVIDTQYGKQVPIIVLFETPYGNILLPIMCCNTCMGTIIYPFPTMEFTKNSDVGYSVWMGIL